MFGEYLDKNPFCYGYDICHSTRHLTKDGKKILERFIKENREKDEEKRKNEQKPYFEKQLNTPPATTRNIWRSGLHIIEHFGDPMIDYKYEFKKPTPVKHLINQPPIRRPKEKGDYFDKDIHLLGAPEKD